MYKTKTMFFLMMIFGTSLTLCSNSWMGMWMGLEINLMSFIPLIKSKTKNTAEAVIIYFLVQSISSTILMFSIIMSMIYPPSNVLFPLMMAMSLLMKMGAAPFHMWLPEMMNKLEWNMNILLMTWQKLGTMIMISNIHMNDKFITMTIILSVMVGAIGGLNQTSLKKILAFSSINHTGWLLSLIKVQNNWMSYLTIYSIMITSTCMMFHKYNMMYISQINMMNLTQSEKISYMTSMMSLGGLPPFIGFLPKWIAIQTLMMNKSYLLLMLMMMFSMITLFYYMRTMSMLIMSHSTINKWINVKSNSKIMNVTLIINFSLPMVFMMNFM
uniref:NADH dehydrogenase subunit 2 n=1 Tax=Megacopta centronubila TaxID=2968963 RepID=UPI00223754DA|nr:NADH dehydrogenase subunit 2 [Megacopta centronubila]UYA97694.1 NADH dehydrogenase subunit 2 [Megacopta centronubila]UYA97707.1 NADH dehydrogenase subunit 2 [Megacopta centronubila]